MSSNLKEAVCHKILHWPLSGMDPGRMRRERVEGGIVYTSVAALFAIMLSDRMMRLLV